MFCDTNYLNRNNLTNSNNDVFLLKTKYNDKTKKLITIQMYGAIGPKLKYLNKSKGEIIRISGNSSFLVSFFTI